jgi:5-methylthioadenosine/S-adenosylhomocysteine deaminase
MQNATLVITMDPRLGDGPLGTLADADVLFAGDTIIAVRNGLAAPADILHRILGTPEIVRQNLVSMRCA